MNRRPWPEGESARLGFERRTAAVVNARVRDAAAVLRAAAAADDAEAEEPPYPHHIYAAAAAAAAAAAFTRLFESSA